MAWPDVWMNAKIKGSFTHFDVCVCVCVCVLNIINVNVAIN